MTTPIELFDKEDHHHSIGKIKKDVNKTFQANSLPVTHMKESPSIERSPLRSGIPCVNHKCIQCCIETRMLISKADIDRISKLGCKPRDFSTETSGGWQLKNRYGKCVFLSKSGCNIYPHRPEGCRLYPLVYEKDSHKAVLDHICPHRYEFDVSKDDERSLNKLLEILVKEKKLGKSFA